MLKKQDDKINVKVEINKINKSKAEDAELTEEIEIYFEDVYRIMKISSLIKKEEY